MTRTLRAPFHPLPHDLVFAMKTIQLSLLGKLRKYLPFLGAWLALLTFTSILAAQATPQTTGDLTAATTTSGLSIHESFYGDLAQDISSANVGHTAVFDGSALRPYTDLIQDLLDQINALALTAIVAALGWLTALFPEIGATISAIIAILLILICGGTQQGFEITVDPASVFATAVVEDLQLSQTSTGHEFDLVLDDVGLLAEVKQEAWIGTQGGTCTQHEKANLQFVYRHVPYKVRANFLAGGGVQFDAFVVGSLPSLEKRFDGGQNFSADSLFNIANQTINGKTLEQTLAGFATTTLPDQLELILASWWSPHLAQAGFLVDLSGTKQNVRYAQNQVAGTVGPALFQPLQSDAANAKVRVTFSNLHSAVTADPLAVCADPTPFVNPAVTPNFLAEGALAEATYHTSYKTFEHRIIAGIRSAVGLRDEDKPGSPYIVDVNLGQMAPETAGYSMYALMRLVSSPILPVPLSFAQANSLLTTPVTGAPPTTLGHLSPAALRLKLRVCEVGRPTVAFPFGPGSGGDGAVVHEVVIEASIETATTQVLLETFTATLLGGLRLSKNPEQKTIEFRTIRAELQSLVNQNGLEWSQVTLSTPFANAPVSLLLKALFGDNSQPFPATDQRAFYLIEGLVGPLIEWAAQGWVLLPGLDLPAFNGVQHGFIQAAVPFYGDQFELGLDFDRDGLCADIVRWGQTQALVSGVPSGTESMLTIELQWLPQVTDPGFKTETGVATVAVPANWTPAVLQNPSRLDTGFLSASYAPKNGDEASRTFASGDSSGPFLPGGGQHFVAATPIAYQNLRAAHPSFLFPDTTFELRPYRPSTTAPCNQLFPGPLYAPPGDPNGAHHVTGPDPDVYEALTFETRKKCLGVGKCDGARVVVMWTAPLFRDCPGPAGPFGVDFHTFNTLEATHRVPPSDYEYHLEECIGQAGGGGVID